MKDWRILVVEDDPDGQTVVAHLLSYFGIAVDIASTGEEALDYVLNPGVRYTGVIIDLALPGIDGWTVLKEIQNNPATANLPCVAITGYHSSNVRDKAIASGFSAYFPKPINATMFIRELEVILR